MGRTVLLVHGRDFKPPRARLRALWLDALRHGLRRDHAPTVLGRLRRSRVELVYFGDLSNRFLADLRGVPAPDDTADRRRTLRNLRAIDAGSFTRRRYLALPGRSPLEETLSDLIGPPLSVARLSERLIRRVAPDICEYWNFDSPYGSRVRETMLGPLRRAMDRDDRILILSHSLGTMIAYDTLWKFSHAAEHRARYSRKKVSLWITLGSPLGDETVKRHLKGAGARGPRRYPHNIRCWLNVSAHDDYIRHDQRLRYDYRRMQRWGLLEEPIEDLRIYNLAVRHGRSNPHSSAGYLVHPSVIDRVARWLRGKRACR
jgi:hypothetical protein